MVFFEQLTQDELLFLSDYIKEQLFPQGKTILRQGRIGGDLYLIRDGLVSVWIALPGDYTKEATTLQPGQFFGEVAFLAHAPFTANIIAEVDTFCFVLTQDVLLMLRVAAPQIAYKIEKAIAAQTAEKIVANFNHMTQLFRQLPEEYWVSAHARHLPNPQARGETLSIEGLDLEHLARLSFFREMDREQLMYLLKRMSICCYDRGYRFVTDNSDNRRLALIYSGAVMLFFKENGKLQKAIAVFGVGELFMENFFLAEFRKHANYVTCEKSIVLELDDEAYFQLQQARPELFYLISQYIHRGIARSVYIVNRQFIRIDSEYHDLLK
ncbi:cNMP binding domain-containing protein [Legionella birminghamensis]|uniref:cNMP binding domain-containing protein n=2 Tax=Legionella birminghamensis TaxID=28083 RepID=A0A378IDL0_9GAMM|nr:cNMP binding domain-containing protein [Legionella birminghamensis]STX33103.1 cNMP binding domain-containing protein [Legionella birminghamensis]